MLRKLLVTLFVAGLLLAGYFSLHYTQASVKAVSVVSDMAHQAVPTTVAITATQTATATVTAIPPIVIDRYPQPRELDSVRPSIGLTFDRPMRRSSIAAALRIEPTFAYRLSVYGTSVNIEPRQPLPPGTLYRFTLGRAATDIDGTPLGEEYTWEYTLPELISTITGPTPNKPTEPIRIYFNYNLQPQRVQAMLVIEPPVEGTLQPNDANTSFTFTPVTSLAIGADYTISFQGPLYDWSENSLPAPAPRRLQTTLPIVTVAPVGAPDYGGAHPATPIQISFDRPMDQAATAAALQVSPPITGNVTWEGNTLRFIPARGYFDPYQAYTVTLAAGLTDATGAAVLTQPYTWRFRTGALNNVADFGWGANVQVVDADGRRALQFQVLEPTLTSADLRLYRLTTDQFREQYAASTRGDGWSFKPISTAGLELAKSWQTSTIPPENSDPNAGQSTARELLLPESVQPGLYILEISAGYTTDQIFLLVTRAVVALKQGDGQAVAWVTTMDGANLPDAAVTIYGRDGAVLGQGNTDEQGILRTALAKDAQPLLVVAQLPGADAADGSALTTVGFSGQWRTEGYWGGIGQPDTPATAYAAHIYTERPIYRPGQTVYFKAILRHDDDAVLTLPAPGTPVTVQMRDAKDNVAQSLALTTNAFGTVNGHFTVATGAVLGDYAIETVIDTESHRQTFKVEEYRKPDFTVTVTTDAATYFQGSEIQMQVESRYLFDEPVASAQLTVTKFLLQPRNWWEGGEGYTWYNSYATPHNGVTDDNGRFTLTLPSTNSFATSNTQRPDWQSSLAYQTWGLEVTVDDGSHQTVSGFAVAKIYNAAEKVSFETGGYVKAPFESFTVQAQVTTLAGEPVATRALTLTVDQISWDNGEKVTNVYREGLVTDAQGQASVPLVADQPGYYRLTLSGVDAQQNPLSYESWLYVFEGDTAGWFATSDKELQIRADRTDYAPGDEAQLVIESTFSGPALLTFERGTTRREQLIQLQAPLTRLSVPLQVDDAPNIFVTVNAWQAQDTTLTAQTWSSQPDRRLRTAKVELQVAVINKRLTIAITPDKSSYAPREEASFSLKVTDENAQPVVAELSLALVDEAIFSLSEELAGPIFDAFYQRRDHRVRTYDSMAPIRWFGGGGGGGGEPGSGPRTDFPDTALWIPVLQTDANGEATITVTLPDNLTTWRLTAKAVTANETQVGEALTKLVTQQALVVRPILPRLLTAGDQVALSAVVHNYSDAAQEVVVTLALSTTEQAARLRLFDEMTQTLQLEPGAAQIVGWGVEATTDGEVALLFAARGATVADAVRLPLTIRPLAIPDVQSQVGEFTGELTTAITLPENALDQSHITLELNRSIAGSLLSGLEYLTGYPYGCVEQTMSRALPNAVVGRALHELGVNNQTLQESLPPLINAGLQQLYSLQHEDGGWGWWYDDESESYQTAWVIFGLAITQETGNPVEQGVIDLGVAWLRQNLPTMDNRTRAFALYSMALAGQGDLTATQALLPESAKLDPFSQAALALTLHRLDDVAAAQAIVERLVTLAQSDDDQVYWPSALEDGYYAHKVMASTTRTTALVLSAFMQIAPGHALEPAIVRWLMGQRRLNGWGSTNETAFTILALTDHLRATQVQATPTTYQVWLNDEEMAQGELNASQPQLRLTIPMSQLAAGVNRLQIQQSGEGPLYYLISSQSYVAQTALPAAGVIEVSRTYRDSRTNQPVEQLRPGQLIKVELTVRLPEDAFYMIVEDKLPGGLEALNEGLNTTSRVASAFVPMTFYWRNYGYNNKEVRDDRVSFFITEMKAGHYIYRYFARATHAGEFVALPAEAYAMYDVTTWGRSSSQPLSVAAE